MDKSCFEVHPRSVRSLEQLWSEHWNGIPKTRVRVTVEIHVFHINKIIPVSCPIHLCLAAYEARGSS